LEEYAIDELIDPRLGDRYSENEVYCMLHAANLCIRRDPHSRPRMSHVSDKTKLFTSSYPVIKAKIAYMLTPSVL
jgi:hypothetical protein